MKLTIRAKDTQLAEAFRIDSVEVARQLDVGLERGAIEITREARRNAPKARTTLTNSIAHARLNVAHFEVVAQARYALAVEEGAGRGGWAPIASLLDWMKIAGVTPRDPRMTMEELAKLLQRSIHAKGTPAQPFMKPAAEAAFPGIEKRIADRLQKIIDREATAA